jgi:hypothetical protein
MHVVAKPIEDYILTEHAATEIERRGLSTEAIDGILKTQSNGWKCDLVASCCNRVSGIWFGVFAARVCGHRPEAC